MEYLSQLFLPISIWLQNSPGWLIDLMQGITFLGNTEFYLLVMPLLFWCIDTSLGIRIGLILLTSGSLNSLLKLVFRFPRPFWVSSQVNNVVVETTFGFPSGHSQNGASIWGLMAIKVNKTWIKILCLILIILIGLSRIVLGVHFTHDVLAGWLVGFLLLFGFVKLEEKVIAWIKEKSIHSQVIGLILVTALLLVPAFLAVNPFDPPVLPEEWLSTAGIALDPFSFETLLTATGALFGLGLGLILQQDNKLTQTGIPIWKLILRYLVGMVGVILFYAGLGAIFPDNISPIAFGLRFLRYVIIGCWISFGAPRMFSWLKLNK
jgi:membrane-associated phospholipid phosphatase